MQTLESLRRQIETATDLQSIVTTMKTLAAVSIRQYERAADALRDYDRTVELGFQILLRDSDRGLIQDVSCGPVGLIVLGSDQGMCGRFNEQIAEYTLTHTQADSISPPGSVLVVGSRVAASLAGASWNIDHTFHVPKSVSAITDLVEDMLPMIERQQSERDLRAIRLYGNRRSSIGTFKPHVRDLLPIDRRRVQHWRKSKWESNSLPRFAGDARQLTSSLIRQHLFATLYRSLAESLASENASRLAAMHAAEKSIDERLDHLHHGLNHQRQTAITEELLDVVTGFEALTKMA